MLLSKLPSEHFTSLRAKCFSFEQAILPDKEIYFLKLFNNWLESAREDLMDMFSVHTVEEIVVRNMF